MKTRTSKKSKASTKKPEDSADHEAPSAAPSTTNPPMLFILPKDQSTDARIVTLRNPATGIDNRYFYDPESGFFEFTKVAAPRKDPTSWLLSPSAHSREVLDASADDKETADLQKGYTIEEPSLYVASAIDIIFLILPALTANTQGGKKQLYLSLDDHIENVRTSSSTLADLLDNAHMSQLLAQGLRLICDCIEAGDETVYRISQEKLARHLLPKAQRAVDSGLPASMEQKLVQDALEIPTAIELASAVPNESQGEESTATDQVVSSQDLSQITSTSTATSIAADSQSSTTTVDSASTAATAVSIAPPPEEDGLSDVRHLLRLRTALDFILAAYVDPTQHTTIRANLAGPASSINFSPLDDHLEHVARLKKEAQALRSLSDNISRKRMANDDDEACEARAEKKRKKEEEEAKKKSQSRAIKQLAKANTSGMQKLSSFFSKGTAKKAKP